MIKIIASSATFVIAFFFFYIADLKKWKNNIREGVPIKCDEERSPEVYTRMFGSGHFP